MTKMTFEVSGVHCPSCKILITDILTDEGVVISSFDIDTKMQTGVLMVDSKLPPKKITQLIAGAGEYKVTLK